jgi:MYXO-CTERM domain-containing protein
VVINPDGGDTAEDGLRIYLGNLGGIQVVRDGSGQFYGDVPTGPEGVNNGFFLAVGPAGDATVYGPQLDIEWDAVAWTAVSQTGVTGAGTAEDPYQVVTVVSAGGFRLGQTVRYVVPKVYCDVRLTLVPPTANDQNLRIYHWLDTYLNGGDFGPAVWEPHTGSATVFGVAKGTQYEVLIQGNRAWNAYFSGVYYRPGELMAAGGSLDNTLDETPTTDNGLAAQWNLGTPTTPVTWTYRIATAAVNDATCGDGEVTGYEGCDDGDTDDGDGCSGICQVEVGYACIGAPSTCEECFEDIDCDDGDDCTTDACTDNACGHTQAAEGSECLTGVCTSGGSCVECVADGDCGTSGPFCNTETNTCYCEVDGDCDDKNECTSAACTDGRCEYTALPSEAECSVGHCNGDEGAPACICETDDDCNDQNSCSTEICESHECLYDYADAGDACETGVCSEDDPPVCLQCYADEHCPSNEPWCKTEIDECVECLEASHCDDTNECTLDGCSNDVCSHELLTGQACTGGGFCSDEAPTCVECVTNANCPYGRPVCDAHQCVRCTKNSDCNDRNDCTADICSADQLCLHNPVEPGTDCKGGYCAGTSNPACVTCADTEDGALDDGCTDDLPVCLIVGNGSSCVPCEAGDGTSGDFGCASATPYCNETATPRTCIECRTTADCTGNKTCNTAGVCVAPCAADADCLDPTASHCIVDSGECVECVSNDDCQGADTCNSAGRCAGIDTDGDGVEDADDLDDDDDGIADAIESAEKADTDGDGLANSIDRDSDGDGIADVVESGGKDEDGDGVWDDIVDKNHNGLTDEREGDLRMVDTDADGTPDYLDTDSDDDGIDDSVEASDANYDGEADQKASGKDEDHDGLDAAFDSSEGGTAASLPDQNNDGAPDYRDAVGMVVIPTDDGTLPGTDEGVDSGAPPVTTTAPTTGTSTVEAGTSEETETSATETGTSEETMTESEAGTSDTGETGTTSEHDAGTTPVTTSTDVVDAGGDAGTDGGSGDDGCGCRVVGAESTQGVPSAVWLLALTGLFVKRRSRSR